MGVFMILPPLTPSTAQNLLAVLQWAGSEGLGMEQVRAVLQEMVSGCGLSPKTLPTAPAAPDTCPSCGIGRLEPVVAGGGLIITGCRRCRYSRIEGV